MIERSHQHPSGLAPDPAEPRFTAEELAEIQPDAELEAEIAAEEAKRDAELRRLGASDEAVARVRGRTGADAAPKQTLADVERELDELRELRKTHRQRYWHPDTQAKEAGLYATLEQMKAAGASAKEEGEAKAADAIGELPEALREEFEKGPHGVEDAVSAIRLRMTMLDDLEDGGERLRTSFSRELPDDTQAIVGSELANDVGRWRAATATELEAFGELPYGAELTEQWGKDTAKLLGRAISERDRIMQRATERSKLKLNNWFAGASAAERKAMVQILATRAIRRL